jgi:dTDP-4-amino-4,6-dideoxygalactose transaminase
MVTKSAKDKSNFTKQTFFTNSAREGWSLILELLKPKDKLLLPSYIGITDREGSGIYDPVLKQKLDHDFYSLNRDLTIPLDLFEETLKKANYKMVLLVHYFGFKINNIRSIVDLCESYGVQVVEDCAHLYNYNLYSLSDAGTYGDFVFYSLHKNFPFESGGMVVQNNTKIPLIDYSKVKLNMNFSNEIVKYDLEAIAKKRVQNFEYLDVLLNKVEGVSRLKFLDNDDIPHNFPIYVENGLRERLYFWMVNKNVTLTALYYRLIDNLNVADYAEMHDLSKSILNLPIHQDMSFGDIRSIVELLIEGISELKK